MSRFRHCGEADGACFLIQRQLWADIIILRASKAYPFLARSSQVRQSTSSSSVSSQLVTTQLIFTFENMPLLRPQYLRLQQSQNLPSVTMSKYEIFPPFTFSFDLFLSLT